MEDVLRLIAADVSLALGAIAILVIVIGAAEAVIGIFRVIVKRNAPSAEKRTVWLEFSRWLIAGLTFLLAADIVETTAAPTWDEIGRVAAIAAIRTILTFFLDRDIEDIRGRQRGPAPGKDDSAYA